MDTIKYQSIYHLLFAILYILKAILAHLANLKYTQEIINVGDAEEKQAIYFHKQI